MVWLITGTDTNHRHFEIWCFKCKNHKEIDKYGINDMNYEINYVIANGIETSKIIIQSKCEKSKPSRPGWGPEVRQVSEFVVFYDVIFIVKVERGREGVGVNKKAEYDDEDYMNEWFFK